MDEIRRSSWKVEGEKGFRSFRGESARLNASTAEDKWEKQRDFGDLRLGCETPFIHYYLHFITTSLILPLSLLLRAQEISGSLSRDKNTKETKKQPVH